MFSRPNFHNTQAIAPVMLCFLMFGTVFVFRIFIELSEKILLPMTNKNENL